MNPVYVTPSIGARFLQVADFAKRSDFDDRQVTVPEEMFTGVAEDQRRREGNKVVRYGPET
jgi:hypothetical protein